MNVRHRSGGRLRRQQADEILGRLSLLHGLLEVGQGLDVEQRDDVHQEEGVQPHGLVHAQRLKRRLVVDGDWPHAHDLMVAGRRA